MTAVDDQARQKIEVHKGAISELRGRWRLVAVMLAIEIALHVAELVIDVWPIAARLLR